MTNIFFGAVVCFLSLSFFKVVRDFFSVLGFIFLFFLIFCVYVDVSSVSLVVILVEVCEVGIMVVEKKIEVVIVVF